MIIIILLLFNNSYVIVACNYCHSILRLGSVLRCLSCRRLRNGLKGISYHVRDCFVLLHVFVSSLLTFLSLVVFLSVLILFSIFYLDKFIYLFLDGRSDDQTITSLAQKSKNSNMSTIVSSMYIFSIKKLLLLSWLLVGGVGEHVI